MKTKGMVSMLSMKPMVTLWDDVSAEASYVAMRFARLVLFLALEVATFFCLVRALVCIFCALDSSVDERLMLPGLGYLVGAIASGILCWSCGTPYRYNTKMPGISVKVCFECGTKISDQWFCPHCGTFRFGKVVSSFLWVVSLMLTVIFVIHDVAWGILAAVTFMKKK